MEKQKPINLKQSRKKDQIPLTIPEILARDYTNRLDMLKQSQEVITKGFIEHPIYHEYHRKQVVTKQYKQLEKDYQNSLKNINKFYKTSKKQYGEWLTEIAIQPDLINPWYKNLANDIMIGFASILGYVVGIIYRLFSIFKK